MAIPPPRYRRHSPGCVADVHQLRDRLGVTLELRRERSRQGRERRLAGLADQGPPALGRRGKKTRAQERGLADPRRSDHRQQTARGDLAPQLRDLGLAAEEELGVGLGEGGESRVRVSVVFWCPGQNPGDRHRVLMLRLDRHEQPVAFTADGLDITGLPRVIAEGPPQLGHDPGQRPLGNELDRPHRVDDVLARHEVVRPLGQAHQDVHHLVLDLDRVVAPAQAV